MSITGRAQSVLRRIGKLLILRLTPRGLRRFRLETTRSCRISASTARWNAARCSGGKGAEGGQFAAHDAHGVQEREPVGILVGLQGGLVHQAANGKMRQKQPVELLTDEVWGLAAQHDAGAVQMVLDDAHRYAARLLSAVMLTGIEMAQIGAVGPSTSSGGAWRRASEC